MSRTVREIYDFHEFRLDVSEHLLLRLDEPVRLPDRAFEILRRLVANAGHLVTKDELLSQVWAGVVVEENSLDKNISLLRRALEEKKDGRKMIATIRGHGYRFVAPVRRSELSAAPEDDAGEPAVSAREAARAVHPRRLEEAPPAGKPVSKYQRGARSSDKVVALADWRRDAPDAPREPEIETPVDSFPAADPGAAAGAGGYSLRRLALAGLLVLCLGAFAALVYRLGSDRFLRLEGSAAPLQAFKIRRFADNGSFKRAAVSPDGKFIAYTDRKFAVWLKNAATDSSVRVLPALEEGERQVIGFSPDQNYLYFHYVPPEGRSEIFKLPVFGGASPLKIAEDTWSQPSLSADGQQIAFTRFDADSGSFRLIAAAADGSMERIVAEGGEGERFVSWIQNTAWSPDSSRIACIAKNETGKETGWHLLIYDAADGRQVLSIDPVADISSLQAVVWLPDGDNLIVSGGDRSSLRQIYRYTISTGEWHRITNDLSDYVNLSVSRDGQIILATLWHNHSNLWLVPANEPVRARQLTFGFNTMSDETGVSWTGDGRIVYASNATGKWEIWMINADGTNQKQLTQDCAGSDFCAMPFVTPDSRYIVFHASRGGEYNIWRMNLDGSDPVQLTRDGGILPTVTSNSRWVNYVEKKVSSSKLRRVSIDGGLPQALGRISPVFLGSISADEKMMAFVYYDSLAGRVFRTCVAPVDAEAPEKCFGKSRSFPRWTDDGQAFYFLAHDYSGIWLQRLDGERDLVVEFPGERINNFAVSPDGKHLVVARSRPSQDIVALISER